MLHMHLIPTTILWSQYYYCCHFIDEERDSEKQVMKLRVTANKKSQVSNLGLARDLELIIINTKLSKAQ